MKHVYSSYRDGLEIGDLVYFKLVNLAPFTYTNSRFNVLVLDREFLVENLRGIRWQTYDRSVDVLVSRLRNKLGETPTKIRFLKTIHGVGYKFVAKLKEK